MSMESLVEAYETLLGKHKEHLIFSDHDFGEYTEVGQYLAHVTVSYQDKVGNAQAIAAHNNPTVAMLLAKVLAVSELVGEPSLPLYEDAQELRVGYTPPTLLSTPAAPSPFRVDAPASGSTASNPVDNSNRPAVDPDGVVRCWGFDAKKGAVCNSVIKAWDGKSPEELGVARKQHYGMVLCPRCIALKKAAGN